MASSSTSEIPELDALRAQIAQCRVCRDRPVGPPLPHEPRPIIRVSSTARILVAGQAPGVRVHRSGMPFTDPSGDRLRQWMGISPDVFYDQSRIAIVPMGFCFPGLSATGSDLPPRRECRDTWHDRLFAVLPEVDLVLAIGIYAQSYHLTRLGFSAPRGEKLDDRVRRWPDYVRRHPRVLPLPHPSWRNSGWLKRNPWFETDLLPWLRAEVARLLS